MSFQDILELVTGILTEAGVQYMLTGSLASSFHGAPRATRDIDLVVDAPLERLLRVASGLRERGLYVSDEALREALMTEGIFNAIDPESGWKIDFIVRKDRPFSRAEFDARVTVDFGGRDLVVTRAEDVVVAKLEWARLGNSDLQIRDVTQIMAVLGDSLDRTEISKWVRQLGLEVEWHRAQASERGDAPS